MCVFGRLMSQLADVNTQSTVGMWHFYNIITVLSPMSVLSLAANRYIRLNTTLLTLTVLVISISLNPSLKLYQVSVHIQREDRRVRQTWTDCDCIVNNETTWSKLCKIPSNKNMTTHTMLGSVMEWGQTDSRARVLASPRRLASPLQMFCVKYHVTILIALLPDTAFLPSH